jgi:hypothetical protein
MTYDGIGKFAEQYCTVDTYVRRAVHDPLKVI